MSELMVIEQHGEVIQPAAENDAAMIELWLHGRIAPTQKAYRIDIERFFAFVGGKPLAHVRLGDLQNYADTLAHLAPASRARKLAVIKSLYSFAAKIGFVRFNVAAALRLPNVTQNLSARILSESDTLRLICLEPNKRNRTLLTVLYASGIRAAEACAFRWRDLVARDQAGQLVVVDGKGGKTRSILLPGTVWGLLIALRGDALDDGFVFLSRGHKQLDRSAILRVVRGAALRAGIGANVSPHWLRHCSASHALDRGAPISLVAATLGHSSIATTGRYTHARPNDSSALYLAL